MPVVEFLLVLTGWLCITAVTCLVVEAVLRRRDRVARRTHHLRLPRCGQCGYIVEGLGRPKCPECGANLRKVGVEH